MLVTGQNIVIHTLSLDRSGAQANFIALLPFVFHHKNYIFVQLVLSEKLKYTFIVVKYNFKMSM